jgi:hypothetical protein
MRLLHRIGLGVGLGMALAFATVLACVAPHPSGRSA